MIFKQYVDAELFKTESATQTALLDSGSDLARIDMLIDKSDPNVLTGRVVQGVVYCIYHKKFINLTELANQIRALYIGKGYANVGFSKLSDKDLVKYATAKTILKKLFDSELYTVEIDPKSAAKYFFAAEVLQS